MDEMEAAATCAAKELDRNWTAVQLAQWWAKWYLKAGHKRLGRILVAMSKGEISS